MPVNTEADAVNVNKPLKMRLNVALKATIGKSNVNGIQYKASSGPINSFKSIMDNIL